MNKDAFNDLTSGIYVISSKSDRNIGCIATSVAQLTNENKIISVSLNKNNYTNKVIKKIKRFSISVLMESTSKELINTFGFKSSKDINKFENIKYEIIDEIPVVTESVCSYFVCDVIAIVSVGTHDLIIAKVIDFKKINMGESMSYKYYQKKLKGITPKTASK